MRNAATKLAKAKDSQETKDDGGFSGPSKHQDRDALMGHLRKMMWKRLFVDERWLANSDLCGLIERDLDELGLQEHLPNGVIQDTQRAAGLELDLVRVFLGVVEEISVPIILDEYGLLTDLEADWIYGAADLRLHGEAILVPFVRKAFLTRYDLPMVCSSQPAECLSQPAT